MLLRAFIIAAIGLALCGCHTAHVNQPLTQTLAGNDTDAQMEFWHQLETRPVTCNDEAFHALLLYMDEKDPASDYAGRVRELQARNMLSPRFRSPPDQAIRRGVLAVALVHMLDIKGGWALHVFKGNERYAVKELVYEGLYPPSDPHQTFSGTEFLGIMGKAEDYRRDNQIQTGSAGTTQPSQQATPEPFGHGATNKPPR